MGVLVTRYVSVRTGDELSAYIEFINRERGKIEGQEGRKMDWNSKYGGVKMASEDPGNVSCSYSATVIDGSLDVCRTWRQHISV